MEQQYVTPEHLLFGIAYVDDFRNALRSMGGDANSLQAHLDEYLSSIDEKTDLRPELSVQLGHVIVDAVHESIKTEMSMVVDWQHYVVAILGLERIVGSILPKAGARRQGGGVLQKDNEAFL